MEPPLFIISSGRAGSTIFHRILCEHPRVAWITALADRFPSRPAWQQAWMKAVDLPGIGPALARVYPGECYDFWEHLAPGFRRPCRDLRADDVSERTRRRIRAALAAIPTERRPRLSLKITGWPRLAYLAEVFPEAKFIHVVRDGRAVANSFLAVPWWLGWHGPQNWRWGELPPEHEEEWESHDRSFVALAGIQWKLYLEAYEVAAATVGPDRLHEVRYEDLCARPEETFVAALSFAGLPREARFEAAVKRFPLESADEKWRRDLTDAQRAILEAVLAPALGRWGYRA